jgi:CheY-like chemotaxis protein
MTKNEKRIVLLVDDKEATCTLITALLQRDFAVQVATDGAEAIEKLKTNQYAAVLLDLRMPHVDGFAVLDHLRDHAVDLLRSVIVLSAALSTRELAHVKEYPVCAIVSKPFDVEDLLGIVRQCAGLPDNNGINLFAKSGPMILLIADLLRNRWM